MTGNRRLLLGLIPVLFAVLSVRVSIRASDADEWKIKRQEVYGFVQQPQVTRDGDRVAIAFETEGFCDVTVAVESADGRIIRHLASGVLGSNAPAPFAKDAKKQTLTWDGKDDTGHYIDEKDALTIRVSLGLQPAFEKVLFWSPKKRMASSPPLMQATEEGVFVYEGRGVDHVRLFDHKGEYVRTVYPFPADKLAECKGLETRVFPQDGKELPVKLGCVQATLLTSGSSSSMELAMKFGDGTGASALAVRGKRIALAQRKLNRLATDGSTGGLALTGPETALKLMLHKKEFPVEPTSAAFSPDGKTLYLTGYYWKEPNSYLYRHFFMPVVMKLDYAGGGAMEVFAGKPERDALGSGPQEFKAPVSVTVDDAGRVYVADYPNDRVQVFAPDGKLLKSLAVARPAQVRVHPKTREIWVFSWMVPSDLVINQEVKASLTRFASFDDPKKTAEAPLPFPSEKLGGFYYGAALRYSCELDGYADTPTLWIVGQRNLVTRETVVNYGAGALSKDIEDRWTGFGIQCLAEKDGKWTVVRNFSKDVQEEVQWVKPPAFARQRLYVNPKTEKLYIAEDQGFGKSFQELTCIDPATGKIEIVATPFDSEDLAFDFDGNAYLRTDKLVMRYDPINWREIAWDYGEEHPGVFFSSLGGGKKAPVLSGLPTPGRRPVFWHQGGMWVNAKGHLAVCCASRAVEKDRQDDIRFRAAVEEGKPYTPVIYPGRARWQEIHVWDKYGKLVYEDAVPGLGISDGLGIDADDNIYLMAAVARHVDGKPYPNKQSGTVMKFRPKKGRILSASGRCAVPLPEESKPKHPVDIAGLAVEHAWVEGAEWLYGGVGYSGMNEAGCCCWNTRYNIDYFARSFAPEIDHFSVAVLDSNGNLILRVGQYGNADSAGPGSRVPLGGDGVGFFYPAYVASHTDHRLFVADSGNARIVSVKLGYHKEAKVPLRGIPDAKGQ